MKIEKLCWDSDFFGLNIGKVEIDIDNFNPILFKEEANDNKFDLVYAFCLQHILPIDKIESAKLDLLDIQLTMSKEFIKDDYLHEPYVLKTSLSDSELIECYKIAEEISIHSRFYKESLIGSELTKRLYRKWIDNALNNSFSDGIIVTKNNGIISGIHIVKTDYQNQIGNCSLIGVNDLYKGKRLGQNLWQQANSYWANESNIAKTKVPFSINNVGSFNFHLKMGFNKIEEIKYIYHFRNLNKIK